MSTLTLEFEADPDCEATNRLHVELAGPFAGRGWCWTDRTSVAAFAAALTAYPIPADRPPRYEMGFNHRKADEPIGWIEVSAHDPRGRLRVRLELAEDLDEWPRVRAEFVTHYPEVERFARQIVQMLDGTRETATLEGSD
jgi:hypothetical protein